MTWHNTGHRKEPVARHICDNCGAAVAEEEFCPTCGAWIDRLDEVQPGPGDEDFEEFSLGDLPPEDDPGEAGWESQRVVVPRQEVQCPSCGSPNPASNRHCEECGARLSQGALPVAPRPAVQATAGTRAVMAISGILVGVVVLALLFNAIMEGDAAPATTTVAADSTTTTAPAPEPIEVLRVECQPADLMLSGFPCEDLVNARPGEFQVNWQALPPEESVTVTLVFPSPMVVRQIQWENLPDGDRFHQNYRAKTVEVMAEDFLVPFVLRLEDQPGLQVFPVASLGTNTLTFTITDAYLAEVVNDQVFTELAIAEITVLGYPAPPSDAPTSTTVPADTTTTG
jgi:RNA polymerase subunit RPABC4/transcription elongation factor Spt4